MRVLFVITCLCFFFLSCTKEVEFDLPAHQSRLVVGSFITAGGHVKVSLTRSRPANDTLIVLESPAVVKIYGPSINAILDATSEVNYEGSFPLRHNTPYTLQVKAEGYESIEATDTIPSLTTFTLESYIPETYTDNEGGNMSSFTIRLKNIPSTPAFYELRLKSNTTIDFGNGHIEHSSYYMYIESPDVIFREESLANETHASLGLLFSNKLIRGSERVFTVNFANDIENTLDITEEVEIQLVRMSSAYYQYQRKLYLNLENQVGGVWDDLKSPVEAYTNVKNGYGIFGAYAISTQKHRIK